MANKGKHLIENDYTPVTYDPQYILMVNHLKKYFPIKGGLLSQTVGHVKAVDGVTFNLRRGCTMGLVGESGCGKSTTGRTILRLGGEKTGGQVLFNGKEVYDMTPAEMRELRTKMQIIFQPAPCKAAGVDAGCIRQRQPAGVFPHHQCRYEQPPDLL